MITEEFLVNVELYKRGLFDLISWYDDNTDDTFRFHKKQIQTLELLNDDSTTFVGYAGSARSGKTVLMCCAAVFECFAYPGVRHLMGRKDMQMLWKTTWKTLTKVLDMFGLVLDEDYRFNGKHYEMTFPNTSQIIAKNLELKPSDTEATAFGSLEITKAFVDQSEHVELKIIEKIQERVGSHKSYEYGLKGKVMETFNPAKTHVHRRYWVPFRDNKESKTKKFVRALPSDNPGKEAVEWLKQKENDYINGDFSEVEYQKQVKGNFDYDDDPNALIETDAIYDLWTNVTEGDEKYISADIALEGSDRAVLGAWEGLKLIDVLVIDKMDAEELLKAINKFKAKHGVRNSRIVFDGDGLGAYLKGFLRGAKPFNNNAKQIETKEGTQYQNLKTQCYYKLAAMINQGAISIDKLAIRDDGIKEDLIQELGQVKRYHSEKDGKIKLQPKEVTIKNIGRSPDISDMLMMRMLFVLKKPKRGGAIVVSV